MCVIEWRSTAKSTLCVSYKVDVKFDAWKLMSNMNCNRVFDQRNPWIRVTRLSVQCTVHPASALKRRCILPVDCVCGLCDSHNTQRLFVYTAFIYYGKSSPVQAFYRSLGLQEAEAPRFRISQHEKVVRFSALRTGCLYPPWKYSWYSFLFMRPEELCQCKSPRTPSRPFVW